jgi:nitrogenase molybdenum-iron protein alpha/beta subunit
MGASCGESCYTEKSTNRDSSEHCALAGATQAIAGIKGSSILVHGSAGCAWMARWARSDQALRTYTQIIATNLLEHNIIYGAKDKAETAAKWILEQWNPSQLFILQGCSGSLISDPLMEISKILEKKHNIPIFCLDTAGFQGLTATGADEVLSAVLERYAEKEETKKGYINLVGPFMMGGNNWVYDLDEMKRLLEALGLTINCVLSCETSIEEIKHYNRAEFDLYLTYEEMPKMVFYEKQMGRNIIGKDLPLPIGIYNTEVWLRGIAQHFGKQAAAENLIIAEKSVLEPLKFMYNATWLLNWFATKYAAIIGPATWASSYARFLYYDLATFPSVIALTGERDSTIQLAKNNLKGISQFYDPLILENALYIQIMNAIKDKAPEFTIGSTQEKSLIEGEGFSHLSMAGFQTVLGSLSFIPYPSVGFRGVPYQLSHLGKLLENTMHETPKWQALHYRGREGKCNNG